MATIYNMAGTTSHSFKLGDGTTIFYGLADPTDDMGTVGDIYVRMTKKMSNELDFDDVDSYQNLLDYPDFYEQEEGHPLPIDFVVRLIVDENNSSYYQWIDDNGTLRWQKLFDDSEPMGRIYYKEEFGDGSRWNFVKSYSFDEDVINAIETSLNSNDFKIAIEYADTNNNTIDLTTTPTTDYKVNKAAYGVTRYGTDTEVVADAIQDYQTYSSSNLPTNFNKNTTTHKFEDKFIGMTPEQVGKNIKVEMTRAITAEGKLNDLTTRTKTNLVSAIKELDADLGTVTTAMTTGTALGGKTISTGNNTDITAADAISTLNTKAGVLTSLTTDEKNTLVGAINEVDSHTDTNTANIGSVTTPMATGTALAGKTIATGNNTDITVANAISTLNTAVKTNKDNIGDLNALTTSDKSNLVLAINSEVSRATGAENNLQDQIDAITSKSDVADIVPNYATLASYDAAPLYDNDVIKVLEDETDNNATTYYRLSPVPTTPDVTVGTKSALPAVTQSDDGKIAKVTADETHSNQTTYYECRNVNGTYEWVYASPSKVEGGSTVIDTAHIWDYIGQEGSYYTKGEADNRFINTAGDTMDGALTLANTGSIDATAGSISVPTLAAGTSSTGAASTAFVTTAISNEDALVVHLAGAETITGNKTFGSGTTTTVSGSISLGSNATATTQAANDSSTKVATTAWVNTTGNNVVHKTDDETIAGDKKFTNTISTTVETPAASQSTYKDILFTVGNSRACSLRAKVTADENGNISHTILTIGSNGPQSTTPEGIVITRTTSGTTVTTVEPAATNRTDMSTIPTVGWVNDPAKSTNVVHRTGDESIAGTKTFTGTIAATSATVNVKTQTQGDNSTKAASTAYVDTGLATKQPTISITSSNNGQVLSNNGTSLEWKTVKDITTLAGLDDTTITSAANGQVLLYNGSKWVNGSQVTATIKYW